MRIIIILLILSSCQSENFNPPQEPIQCDNSKPVFSEWIVEETGDSIDLTGAEYATFIPITESGICRNSDHDYLAYFEHDGYLDLRDCTNTYSINVGSWSKSCNVLTIEYTDGSIDRMVSP